MILNATARPGNAASLPWLIWLHGFLGSQQEWQQVAEQFSDYPQLFIDLPGHGGSADVRVASFEETCALLDATLAHHAVTQYWLIGYSLGGRIAMHYACGKPRHGLLGLIVEGSHPGLTDPQEREARIASDSHWASKFREAPLEQVLNAWYQQPVFANLSATARAELVALRRRNHPQALAAMLEATSLGRQADLRGQLSRLPHPFIYFCGEQDSKFRGIATTLNVPCRLITAAGHNAHREAPLAFAQSLSPLLPQPD
ncbi:2-succinyl-6-hydroxy-2,4-cyclohexadiene-1-carboxylate synthase [Atlantibacter sp. RC6]|uniref:2-succinyl-6-hydroxy-2, 4-cyclohexadiene-1-carboxylate synthase n=1 Tax=Atlantibacter sp. RC6 TaxID=2587036 RepID=UPI00160610E2|nr:2-succinyl-6-hydroxy-2,4-cyclohexadiene-1-carboxylate synthase [Atlantibacter sp. RC6]MBB3321409.1 2-succinyl-6-hydroxy-2,4-cyclohexadiene-1-carboxylate synthase [Atlantibacter sp. RC6]